MSEVDWEQVNAAVSVHSECTPVGCDARQIADGLAAERARAERSERERDAAVKARLDWQADYDREKRQWRAMIDDARQRAEARESRLRALLTKTVLDVVVDSGGVNAWHCRVCFGTARSGQAPLHLPSCKYVAALAGTPGGEPEFTPEEREAILSGSLTVPRSVVERAEHEQARAALAGESAPECTEDRHIVLPGGEACVCGENRMEPLL